MHKYSLRFAICALDPYFRAKIKPDSYHVNVMVV